LVTVVGVVVALGAAGLVAAAPSGAAAATKCADPSGTVKVGLSFFGSLSGALNGIGGSETSELVPADQAIVDNYQKGIDQLNEAGGLAGCQVEKVIFNFKATAGDFNQQSQQECASFTQDNNVVAVYASAFETKVAVDCFAKAKTPLFQIGTNYPLTCQDMKQHAGYLYAPVNIATCRFGSFIGIWNKAGLFTKDAKVGILAMDDGSGQGQTLADDLWTPALKKLKIPAETFTYPGATSSAGFAATGAALANGLLKFKADGVNVVLFTPAGAQGVASFMPQAAAQDYFPSYGLDTADSLQIAQTIGAAAIKKAIAISWGIADMPLTVQNTLPENPAITKCATWSQPNPAVQTVKGSSTYCDFLNLLQAGFASATKTDPASLRKGVAALGTTFASSVTYGGATKFGPTRFDGAYQVRLLEFDPGTKSFPPMKGNTKAITVP
jgi:hypothetical protein